MRLAAVVVSGIGTSKDGNSVPPVGSKGLHVEQSVSAGAAASAGVRAPPCVVPSGDG